MNIRQQMDPLASFKLQIQTMFQRSFQELTLKNNLNKTILNNLMEAAKDQEHKISQLDKNIEHLRSSTSPDPQMIRTQVNNQQQKIYDNFNLMMARLNQVQEGISKAKRNLEGHLKGSGQVNQKLDILTSKLQKIEKEQGGFHYRGSPQDLQSQMQDFQKLLTSLEQTTKSSLNQLDFSHKTQIQQPLNTFQTKMMLHNKNNEDILKTKLRQFMEKLKKVQKRIAQTTQSMNGQFNKSTNQQKRIISEMNIIEGEMGQLRNQLQNCQGNRKQAMQKSAATLDGLVQQMLYQAKKLQMRVEGLRKDYQGEEQKCQPLQKQK